MSAGLIAAFLGYLLVWAAVKNVHPWAPIVEAFGGQAPPPPGTSLASGGAAVGTAIGTVFDTSLTPRAARFKAAIERAYPQALYLGGFDCRPVIPHDRPATANEPWSEHSWGNAVDFTGTPELMRKIIVYATLRKLQFGIATIIPPGSSVNAVHVDFLPSHSGVPPCAQSGGGK